MRHLLLPLLLCLPVAGLQAMSFLPGSAVARVEPPKSSVSQFAYADKILVKKSERRLYLLRAGKPFRTYSIRLGSDPEGHKRRQGDGRTPEGRYRIDARNPGSKFYKSLHISYPNSQDRSLAYSRGVNPGGAIMIHGEPPRRHGALHDLARKEDWTQGCIAMSNLAIEEVWDLVALGTEIEIVP